MDSILKDKVQRTAWNKVFDSGSAISLKKSFIRIMSTLLRKFCKEHKII